MVLIFQTNWQHLMTLNAQGFFFFFLFWREPVLKVPMRKCWVGLQVHFSFQLWTSLSLQSPAQVLLPGLHDMQTLRESRNKQLLTGALDSGQERPGAASSSSFPQPQSPEAGCASL